MVLKIINDCHILNGTKGYNALKKPSKAHKNVRSGDRNRVKKDIEELLVLFYSKSVFFQNFRDWVEI